ncbi:hypothetical protein GALMADRAFT_1343942, partial [Galerina marginata CBS 339.88]
MRLLLLIWLSLKNISILLNSIKYRIFLTLQLQSLVLFILIHFSPSAQALLQRQSSFLARSCHTSPTYTQLPKIWKRSIKQECDRLLSALCIRVLTILLTIPSQKQINLVRNISNYLPAVQDYRHLLTHLESPQFQALGPALEAFRNQSFLAHLQGFFVSTDCPLYKLGCLLGEKWLEEDIFNALTELTYFR